MVLLFLLLGLSLILYDIFWQIRSLKENILKRLVLIVLGIISLWFIDETYLKISLNSILYGFLIGMIFLTTHLIIAKGIKLKRNDINKGLVYTSLLIYGLEIPAEEFLYRGIIFIPLLKLLHPILAAFITSTLFLVLHIKTWNNTFVWVGSFVLAFICALSVYFTKSIWAAIIIHNLNDFGFMTLINKRNIFSKQQ